MAPSSSSVFRKLHGLFAVYKPPGLGWRIVRDTLEMKLLKGLNAIQQSSQENVLSLPEGSKACSGVDLMNVVTSVPSLVDHVLVRGPDYRFLKIGVGHRLDKMSTGVMVFGIGHGAKILPVMYENHCTRDYTVCGTFGKATVDFSDTGNVIEKTTFDHISRDKFERVLAMIQGANQKALIMHSNLDLKSQEAYDLAVQGQLHPMTKSPPLILAIRCLEFSPPDFTLEFRCIHESPKYLRKVIHEIGLELKSTAMCTKVRCTRDGPFTLDCSLTRQHWDLDSVRNAIKESQPKVKKLLKQRMDSANTEEIHRSEEGSAHTQAEAIQNSEVQLQGNGTMHR